MKAVDPGNPSPIVSWPWLPEGQDPHHPLKVAARVRIPLGLPIASSGGPSFILSPCVNDYIFTRVK